MSITPIGPPESLEPPTASQHHPFRPAAFPLLSAVIPGSGHFLVGRGRQGAALLISFVILLLGFWPFRVLHHYSGFLGLFGSWIVLGLYASCSAFLSSADRESRRPSKWWLLLLVPACVAIISLDGGALTRLSGFRSFKIPSAGMEPTIRQGDHIVADMSYYRSRAPSRLDTILFERDQVFYIKRVIAAGGDSIEGKDGAIYVNGRKLDEPYVEHIGDAPDWANTFGPVHVPPGKFFVMGDNRDYSLDSRSEDYGLVDQPSVVGKPLYIFESDRTGQSIR